jgi:hypothetical protein
MTDRNVTSPAGPLHDPPTESLAAAVDRSLDTWDRYTREETHTQWLRR